MVPVPLLDLRAVSVDIDAGGDFRFAARQVGSTNLVLGEMGISRRRLCRCSDVAPLDRRVSLRPGCLAGKQQSMESRRTVARESARCHAATLVYASLLANTRQARVPPTYGKRI